jgi:MerR family redox-sensitive transcriptional activator SoxR
MHLGGIMRIGQVAKEAGLKTSALRFYEQAGLLPRPPRESGRRVYDQGILNRLAVVQFAQACGFRLKETRELLSPLFDGEPVSTRWRRLAVAKVAELDRLIAKAQLMKEHLGKALACPCDEVDQCGRTIRSGSRRRPRA